MDFDGLRIFARVAELASFSRAAEQLGMAKSHVSASVQQLEATLATRLLHRTTRSVRLTQDGERFLERCRELMVEAEQLATMFKPIKSGLTGCLRIDMPNTLARDVIIPRLPGFLSMHPELKVGISTTDRRVDLVQEGFDCVLRVGALENSDLVARPLGRMRMVNAASPAYLAAHGRPDTLLELASHRVVHYAPGLNVSGAGFEYFDLEAQRYQRIPMASVVTVNGTDAYQAAALAGLGIIQAPAFGLQALVATGALVLFMPELTAAPLQVSLMVANRRQLAPRVQAFMLWLGELLVPFLAPKA